MLQPFFFRRFVFTDHDNFDLAHGPRNTSNSAKRPNVLWREEHNAPSSKPVTPTEAK